MTCSLEEKKKQIKKINKYYIIVLILCLIIFVIGITTAYYSFVASEKEDSTRVYTGTLIINFKDGVEIHNPYLIPRYEPNSLNDNKDLYTNKFSIESTGTLAQTFDVYLNVTTNEFKDNSLNYKIYNSKGNEIKKGNITKNGNMKLIENTYLDAKDKAEYTLVIWMAENGKNQNDEQAKNLVGTLSVEAVQIKK